MPYLSKIFAGDYVIVIDDCDRKGEENLLQKIRGMLNKPKIGHTYGLHKSGGNRHVGVIFCKKWRFLWLTDFHHRR